MPAVNRSGFDATKTTPAIGGEAVVPHDVNELTYITRAIWVGGAGAISIRTESGDAILLSGVPAGTLLPIRAKGINATGTTATLIVALS